MQACRQSPSIPMGCRAAASGRLRNLASRSGELRSADGARAAPKRLVHGCDSLKMKKRNARVARRGGNCPGLDQFDNGRRRKKFPGVLPFRSPDGFSSVEAAQVGCRRTLIAMNPLHPRHMSKRAPRRGVPPPRPRPDPAPRPTVKPSICCAGESSLHIPPDQSGHAKPKRRRTA